MEPSCSDNPLPDGRQLIEGNNRIPAFDGVWDDPVRHRVKNQLESTCLFLANALHRNVGVALPRLLHGHESLLVFSVPVVEF